MEGEKFWVNKSTQEAEKGAQQKDSSKEEAAPVEIGDETDENGFFLEEQEEDDRESF